MPSSSIDFSIPYTLFFGKKPNFQYYHKFGCLAFSQILKQNCSKFDSHTNECIYLGPDSDHCIHNMFNPKTNKTFKSRNVKFFENELYCENLSKPDNLQSYKEYNQNLEIAKNLSSDKASDNDMDIHSNDDTPLADTQFTSTDNFKYESTTDELDNNKNSLYHKNLNDFENRLENPGNMKMVVNDLFNSDDCESIEDELALSAISGPVSYKMALKAPDSEKWLEAINSELLSISKNDVWNIMDKPKDANIVSTRWVFVKKLDENGQILKYKARLVAHGFEQVFGVDYNETFAPVVRVTSIHLILSLAIRLKMKVHQMDVKTAFLNGEIKENVYIEVPDSVNGDRKNQCCKLNHSLYGLKQSPLSWNIILDQFLTKQNLSQASSDYGVYFKKIGNVHLFITTYIDDLVIASEDILIINSFKQKMTETFEMTDLGELKYILGIHVEQSLNFIKIHQRNYIRELVTKFKLEDSRVFNTPMETGLHLRKCQDDSEIVDKPYASLIGSLLYLSNCTRPDITFAVNRLSSYNAKPTEQHWKSAKRVLKYLKNTEELGITYTASDKWEICGYSDSD
jgi:hypothetical protein